MCFLLLISIPPYEEDTNLTDDSSAKVPNMSMSTRTATLPSTASPIQHSIDPHSTFYQLPHTPDTNISARVVEADKKREVGFGTRCTRKTHVVDSARAEARLIEQQRIEKRLWTLHESNKHKAGISSQAQHSAQDFQTFNHGYLRSPASEGGGRHRRWSTDGYLQLRVGLRSCRSVAATRASRD